MKKLKNLIAFVMVVILIFCFTVSSSATTVLDGSTSNDYKIDAELESVMNEATDNENIEVVLWLSDVDNEERSNLISEGIRTAETKGALKSDFANITDLSVLKSTMLSTEEVSEQAQTLIELKRDVENELHTENNANVLSRLASSYDVDTEPLFVSNYAPLVIMDMTKSEIEEVVNNQLIEKIYFYETDPIVENSEFADNISISQEDSSVLTSSTVDTDLYPYGVWQEITGINKLRDDFELTGLGIKIGALEINSADFEYNGITEEDQEQLYEQFAYHIDNNLLHFSNHEFSNNNGNHGNYTLSILSGFTDDYQGVAPRAEIYCDGYYEEYPHMLFTPTETMINNGVNIISASLGWGYPNNGYNYIVKYFDYIISNCDVVMCVSSGNATYEDDLVYEIRSSATPYNTITVGNIDDKNTVDKTDDILGTDSRYSGSTNSVYKPDICAPGSKVATYVVPEKTTISNGGTSAACPVVAGVCALLMEAFPNLKTQPMLVKSLLMSSAYELDTVDDIYSTEISVEPALTRECGPGMVDAYAAYTTYLNGNYRYSEWDYLNSYNHAVHVSQSEVDAEKDIYLSLNWMQWNTANGETWNSEANYNVLNGFQHTLSLYDPTGDLVAVSDYQYDRKQFIRYKPLETGRYTAKITRSYTGSPAYYPTFAVAHCIK